jgi:hypothetical protein
MACQSTPWRYSLVIGWRRGPSGRVACQSNATRAWTMRNSGPQGRDVCVRDLYDRGQTAQADIGELAPRCCILGAELVE